MHSIEEEIEEESYFVSMTDMMVGMLFLFIIMLMIFVLQYKDTTEELTGADAARRELLENIESILEQEGVEVLIDLENGVLRLPDEILFASGRAAISERGEFAIGALGLAMEQVLPCYSFGDYEIIEDLSCNPSEQRIETIFIEGHTDKIPLGQGLASTYGDNYGLSAARAGNTFRKLMTMRPGLSSLRNRPSSSDKSEPLFSIAGYGPDRPVDEGNTESALKKNRRIDIRIVMATPQSNQLIEFGQDFNDSYDEARERD